MTLDRNQTVHAHVLLAAASGRSLAGAQITAATLAEHMPAPETVTAARRGFESLGLEVGPAGGLGFSLSGEAGRFEEVFGVTLEQDTASGLHTLDADGTVRHELPLDALPDELSTLLEAVTFSPPPDFGPTEFF